MCVQIASACLAEAYQLGASSTVKLAVFHSASRGSGKVYLLDATCPGGASSLNWLRAAEVAAAGSIVFVQTATGKVPPHISCVLLLERMLEVW